MSFVNMLFPAKFGVWADDARQTLERLRGRVVQVVKRCERTRSGITYEIYVGDHTLPIVGTHVWSCFHAFLPLGRTRVMSEAGPSVAEASREQDRLAELIWEEYGAHE
jgi:hypothetical protein